VGKPKLPSKIIQILFVVLSLAYPLLVYFGLSNFGFKKLFFVIAAIALLKLSFSKGNKKLELFQKMGPALLLVLSLVAWVGQNEKLFLYYPLAINLGLLLLFSSSLFREKNIVELLARLKEPELPESGVRYTKKVCILWCGYFLVNSFVVFYTIHFTDLETWTLYNGFISYVVIAVIAGLEFLVRQKVKQRGSESN
tara:strand:- start:16420 stop:17007 length:588 start_codon:yes stop_codon:yes gene_type:complete